jgi:hypothetical protein
MHFSPLDQRPNFEIVKTGIGDSQSPGYFPVTGDNSVDFSLIPVIFLSYFPHPGVLRILGPAPR